jgi:2-C-methyl-D-erythritol 4-phosphate cytidylyltransferase
MSVGANIKKRRFELRMSQQELADAMGYSTRSTIAKIESGENDVSQKKLQKFATALDTTVEALISGYAAPSPAPAEETAGGKRRSRGAVIILAGGKAGQNRQNVPTQFVNVHGKPILVYCMDAYQAHPSVDDIYVVCLKGWESIVRAYAEQYGITKLRGLIPSGSSGVASLKNALDHIQGKYGVSDTILIQEATRPLVRPETISRLLQACTEHGSATAAYSMREFVQFVTDNGKPQYIDRNAIIALQSPEAHRLSLLNEIYLKAAQRQHPLTENSLTMLMHELGYAPHFVESAIDNPKLAREEDIAAFSALVRV